MRAHPLLEYSREPSRHTWMKYCRIFQARRCEIAESLSIQSQHVTLECERLSQPYNALDCNMHDSHLW
jgi:hypothetical protein